MGHTIIEKIVLAHSSERLREIPGSRILWLNLDVRSARDFGGANVVKAFREEYPGERVDDARRTCFTFDCVAPANNIPYANNQQACRLFAREQGIEVHDVDSGIGSHVLIERGLAVPGATVVGTDSHMNLLGAVGALGLGMGDQDVAFAFRTGRTWFEVPESVKVRFRGVPPAGTSAKDLALLLLGRFGSSGLLGFALEYAGEAVERMPLAGRITLASLATEMGAIVAFIPPDEATLAFLSARSGRADLAPVEPDPDARYAAVKDVDVSALVPLVAAPPRPSKVVAAKELSGVRIDSAFFGSCTNGRTEDFRAAAAILNGRRVARHLMAKLVPATREVYGEMLREGLLGVFHEAGVIVAAPGCGGCASGQIGMTGKGEVQVSTGNRNFPGKQGAGETYLASPETVAASALLGRIADPREVGRAASAATKEA